MTPRQLQRGSRFLRGHQNLPLLLSVELIAGSPLESSRIWEDQIGRGVT